MADDVKKVKDLKQAQDLANKAIEKGNDLTRGFGELLKANLKDANLSNAILIDADFRTAILKNTILSNVIYCRTKMPWGEENNDC